MIPPWVRSRFGVAVVVIALYALTEIAAALKILPFRLSVWLLGLPILAPLLVWWLPTVWFHRDARLDEANHLVWFWGDDNWRAVMRSVLPGSVLVLVFFIGLAFPEWFPSRQAKDVLVWAIASTGALTLATWFFNWPKLLVPPHLRSQPGILGEWWAGFEQWRRERRGPHGG